MKKLQKSKILILTLIASCVSLAACDDTPSNQEDGPKPATQSDFIGTWGTDYITANIAVNKFGFVNRARIPNIVFEMNVSNWEKVPCEVTFVKEVKGKDVPDEDLSRDWRVGKTTYKITGTVTSNNSPYNDLANIGSTQSIYLHHSGYSAIFIGITRTDASSGYFYKK
jgi:hypothetical protein